MINEIDKPRDIDRIVNNTMNYTYMIITKQITADELMNSDISEFGLLFDPEDKHVDYNEIIQVLLDHFIYLEEYEKCQDLVDAQKAYYSDK